MTDRVERPGALSQRAVPVLLLFAGLAMVWAAANWPGLREPWWYFDDWSLTVEAAPFARSYQNGRPLEGLWLLMYGLEGTPSAPGWNVFTRAIQGVVHVSAATVAVHTVARRVGVPIATLAVAPFLLWPFGAEATLWRAAGVYPWAALCSVAAVAMMDGPRSWIRGIAAGTLGVAAMLFQQCGAFVGVTLWLVLLVTDSLGDRSIRRLRESVARAAPFALGLVVGGLISIVVLKTLGQGGRDRGYPATDFFEKVGFLVDLNEGFLNDSRNYPRSLRRLHVIVLVGTVALLAIRRAGLGRRWWTALLGLGACLVAPYLAVLVTAGNTGPWRVMYAAPLLFAATLLVAVRVARSRSVRVLACAAQLAILVHYVPMAWCNAGEYPEVFRRDLELAERIDRFAVEHGAEYVAAPTKRDVGIIDWNPYKLRYMHSDSKVPALFRNWSARQFLRWLVHVPEITDPELRARCVAFVNAHERNKRFQIVMLPGTNVICIIPP